MKFLVNVIGILVVIAILFLISWNRKQIQWKSVLKGLIAQFIIAILLVKVPVGKMIVSAISNGITAVINCGADGLSFVFGDLLDASFANVFIVQGISFLFQHWSAYCTISEFSDLS